MCFCSWKDTTVNQLAIWHTHTVLVRLSVLRCYIFITTYQPVVNTRFLALQIVWNHVSRGFRFAQTTSFLLSNVIHNQTQGQCCAKLAPYAWPNVWKESKQILTKLSLSESFIRFSVKPQQSRSQTVVVVCGMASTIYIYRWWYFIIDITHFVK